MSIATMSARVHNMIPQDELIGSLTKERIALAIRYAGSQSIEDISEARHWLAYALNTEVTHADFNQVVLAYEQRERLEDCDLEFWFEVANNEYNRVRLTADAARIIDNCVEALTTVLCGRLGVTQ